MLKTVLSSSKSASMALSRLTLKRNMPNKEVSGMFLHSTKLVNDNISDSGRKFGLEKIRGLHIFCNSKLGSR